DVSLERLGARGLASGRVVLRGKVSDPSTSGELNLTGVALPGHELGANATLRSRTDC
ncbi:MAG: hypothetical protein HC933_05645, partial [Pleurocapsa sp. SU_196_0]|nr:hypothetical protein [Pleurocapsa sp. SU_196_0]